MTGYDPAGRPHQLSRTVKGTKRQAQTALAKFVAEVEERRAPISGAMTFGQFLEERWLPHVAAVREPTTYEVHAGKVKNHVKPDLGHIRLDRMSARDIDQAMRRWEKTLKPSSVVVAAATVSTALEQARRWGLIPANPATLATRPRVPTRKSTVPSLAEVGKLISAVEADDPTLAAAITVAATTGLRRGELCGLRWCDLNDEDSDVGRRARREAHHRAVARRGAEDPPGAAHLD